MNIFLIVLSVIITIGLGTSLEKSCRKSCMAGKLKALLVSNISFATLGAIFYWNVKIIKIQTIFFSIGIIWILSLFFISIIRFLLNRKAKLKQI